MGQDLGSQPVASAWRKVVSTVSRRQGLGNLLHCGVVGKQLVSGGRPGMGGWTILAGEFCLNMAYGVGKACVWKAQHGLWFRESQCVQVFLEFTTRT